MKLKHKIRYINLLFLIFSLSANSQTIQEIFVLKEIDESKIIVITQGGDKLLLKKFSARLSPLIFEGRKFYASISPMWVKIYFDDREPIKWEVVERLGKQTKPNKSKLYEDLILGKTYIGVDSEHWIQKVIDYGKIIVLEDGSLWEVSALDQFISFLWLPMSNIYVIESDNPLYPYKLINIDDDESVQAKYIGQRRR
ncbi:MAG: hypothetical protein ABDI07_10365 [Candidatus Kryptonium sp.]